MLVDVHQHLWTEPLVEALAERDTMPFVRRAGGGVMLELAGEHPYPIDVASEAVARRTTLVRADGLDRAVIALSSPLGIEALPRVEAQPLIEAYVEGVAGLPGEFAAWGPVALDGAGPADVDRVLGLGFVGVSVPAGALVDIGSLAAVLERLEQRGKPLFVHPGPGLGISAARTARAGEPSWWQALTGYVAEMQAAWLSFASVGRRAYPELRVVFAMLAGGAPLLSERLEVRRAPSIDLRDPFTFYESSSYGPFAIEAMVQRVGAAQMLYGSDRPVVEPTSTGRDEELRRNGAWLLEGA